MGEVFFGQAGQFMGILIVVQILIDPLEDEGTLFLPGIQCGELTDLDMVSFPIVLALFVLRIQRGRTRQDALRSYLWATGSNTLPAEDSRSSA